MMRLDVFLTTFGHAQSRTQARVLIEEGAVLLNGKLMDKASFSVDENANVSVEIIKRQKYVGRGGFKLEKALEVFSVDVSGACALDVGASTGGFTDCLLQNGAVLVYAVDSGAGQLAQKLLSDERVVNMEKYNARNLSREDFPRVPSVAVMDVSFISQTLILPSLSEVLADGGVLVSLIKPQFEAGRAAIGKNGIVKRATDRRHAIERVLDRAETCGLACFGLDVSPILGGDGNIEYIAAFRKGGETVIDRTKCIELAERRGKI
ncbi:MAG: TlyA family RNA methyltransferase [Clostridia bacterium]|nr:TlyA family RNA methyltransferase [Clostridia bacterium]